MSPARCVSEKLAFSTLIFLLCRHSSVFETAEGQPLTFQPVIDTNGSSYCATSNATAVVAVSAIVGIPDAVPDVVRCGYACTGFPRCSSYNYRAGVTANAVSGVCELFDYTPRNCTTSTTSSNCFHYQVPRTPSSCQKLVCDPHCVSGCYGKEDGKCDSQCAAGWILQSNFTCGPCDAKCAGSCSTAGAGKCDSLCQPGYALTNDSYCSLVSSCKDILRVNPSASSGMYTILSSKRPYEVYCEMSLNNGSYIFFNSSDIGVLTNDELQAIYTDTTSFLFRTIANDSTQSYGVLRQLSQYATTPLKLGLNDYTGYFPPPISATSSYIFYGFLPTSLVVIGQNNGLQVNNYDVIFTQCDENNSSYFSLYNNPPGVGYTGYFDSFTGLMNSMTVTQPANYMPSDYFTFMWTGFGGCGWYVGLDGQSSYQTMLLAAIGFR